MKSPRGNVHISRRNLLKAMTAAGGSLAASMFLPGQWVKPVLRIGVLPAHAQTSGPIRTTYQIVDTVAEQEPVDGCFQNLSVTIAPPSAGIQMQVVIIDTEDVRTETLTAATDAAGVATFDLTNIFVCTGGRTTTVTFSFVDASLCTTNCSIQSTFPVPE